MSLSVGIKFDASYANIHRPVKANEILAFVDHIPEFHVVTVQHGRDMVVQHCRDMVETW